GIERLRFTTSHPVEFSQNLIDAYGDVPKLANHLHLPVQSGSDRVLALMKRGHTVLEYKSKIRRIRAHRPDIALSSDLIVGFPGESESDFQDTLDLVRELDFDISFSFIYSARPGTPAASLPDPTPLEEKKERLERLQDRLRLQASRHARRMVGRIERVLVTGPSKRTPDALQGRTENNRVVNFRGHVSEDFVVVRITEALPNSLRGVLEHGSSKVSSRRQDCEERVSARA
ncbi:MAG: TRAM domain-containing protein, partial [Pseudomonadales bacterium]|nr:TRAM domain-containing protein [Pseudomonadales bacterium]